MSKTKTESKFKLKNYISYIMVIAVLGVSVILQLTGNLQRSASTLLVQIAYSIILAVSSASCRSVTRALCASAHISADT